jgi:hypothetical protein
MPACAGMTMVGQAVAIHLDLEMRDRAHRFKGFFGQGKLIFGCAFYEHEGIVRK